MELYFKASALILVTVILSLFLGKLEKDVAMLVTIAACCFAGGAVLHYLEPTFSMLSEILSISSIQNETLGILLKVVGITFLSETAGAICSDAGNGSLAKMLQFLSSGVVLYLSVPVIQILLDLVLEIMGEL